MNNIILFRPHTQFYNTSLAQVIMMLVRTLLALSISVVTTAISGSDVTPGGLYIAHRDEVPPYTVTIRQVRINVSDPETIGTLSEWNITLGPSAEQLEVLQFGTIDTKNYVLISKFSKKLIIEGSFNREVLT